MYLLVYLFNSKTYNWTQRTSCFTLCSLHNAKRSVLHARVMFLKNVVQIEHKFPFKTCAGKSHFMRFLFVRFCFNITGKFTPLGIEVIISSLT